MTNYIRENQVVKFIAELNELIKDNYVDLSIFMGQDVSLKLYIVLSGKTVYCLSCNVSNERLHTILEICSKSGINQLKIAGTITRETDIFNAIKDIKICTLDLSSFYIWCTELADFYNFIAKNNNISRLIMSNRQSANVQNDIYSYFIDALQTNTTLQYFNVRGVHSDEHNKLLSDIEELLKRNRVLNRSLFGLCSTAITETGNRSLLEELPPILKEHAIVANRDLM